jgi:hypothetical protein
LGQLGHHSIDLSVSGHCHWPSTLAIVTGLFTGHFKEQNILPKIKVSLSSGIKGCGFKTLGESFQWKVKKIFS